LIEVAETAAWLIGPARLSGDASVVATGFVERMVAQGLPVHRMRMAMRVDNPLLRAWGLSWTPESGAEVYTVLQTLLDTPAYAGSPVQHVIETRQTFRRRLAALGASDHPVLHELAGQGFCDYFAVPVAFGNGVVQAAMFATRNEAGFGDDQIAAVGSLATPLAAALEPIAMRRSTASLLAAFLGEGPAARVQAGAVRRGDVVETEAAILLADMRGFTPLSLALPPDELLTLLGRYFEAVVNAVRAEGGDVLKFIGDGVLAIFPVLEGERDRRAVCAAAVRAAARAVAAGEESSLPAFVTALHVGPVIYGNVGSASRLDFTVVGPTVNTVSRLELVAKANNERTVCSASFARHLPEDSFSELGVFELKGLEAQPVFSVLTERFPGA
jgi:adenylate cyclase